MNQETEKLIAEAVAKAREEWAAEAAERERQAGLSAEERLTERERALEERERELTRREARAKIAQMLAGCGLPAELADVMACESEAEAAEAVEALEKAFREAVHHAVDERLKGGTPQRSDGTADTEDLSDSEYYASLR